MAKKKHETSADMILRWDPIVEYNMNPQEAKAWKLCCHWCKLSKEILPDYPHMTVPKKGDPRKGALFKYMWRLARDLEGWGLEEKEFPLYMRAQLEMLKNIQMDDKGTHANINPSTLTGERAWRRWKIYKRNYDKVNEKLTHTTIETKSSLYNIAQELQKTKLFFHKQFEELSFPNIKSSIENGDLQRWVKQKFVSPYYCLLSPWVRSCVTQKMSNFFSVDMDIYKDDISGDSLNEMIRIFPHEFA